MAIAKLIGFTIKKILFLGTGSTLLILLTIKYSSDRFLAIFSNIIQFPPTQTQVDDSALLLKQIQTLSELTTTIYQMETIVPTHADRTLNTLGKDWKIATTKLLYLAKGEVRAGIDLSQLTQEDIQVSPKQIVISLPPAKILDSKIDINNSQVYHYDRGFLSLGPDVAPQLQTLAQQKTLDKLVTTTCNEGILTTANDKAQAVIQQFLTITSPKDIEIKINTSISQNCNL